MVCYLPRCTRTLTQNCIHKTTWFYAEIIYFFWNFRSAKGRSNTDLPALKFLYCSDVACVECSHCHFFVLSITYNLNSIGRLLTYVSFPKGTNKLVPKHNLPWCRESPPCCESIHKDGWSHHHKWRNGCASGSAVSDFPKQTKHTLSFKEHYIANGKNVQSPSQWMMQLM